MGWGMVGHDFGAGHDSGAGHSGASRGIPGRGGAKDRPNQLRKTKKYKINKHNYTIYHWLW